MKFQTIILMLMVHSVFTSGPCPYEVCCDSRWTRGNTVYCSFLGLTSFPALQAGDWPQTELRIQGNSFRDVTSAVEFPPQLKKLYMNANGIRNIDPAAFSPDLTLALRELALGDNELRSISDIVFPSSLERLSAEHNRITSISAFHFTNPNLNSLRRLELSFNPISSIDNDAFSHLTSLRVLTLMEINPTSLDFSLPSSLRQLVMSHTPITSISSDIFSHLQDFRSLYLDFTGLTSIDGISLPSSLNHLYLQGNPISNIPNDAFSQLTDLRTLSLSGTQLTSIDGLSLPASLETLDLSDTPLSHLPMSQLSSLTNLANLWMDRIYTLTCDCGEAASSAGAWYMDRMQGRGMMVFGNCQDGTSIESFLSTVATLCP